MTTSNYDSNSINPRKSPKISNLNTKQMERKVYLSVESITKVKRLPLWIFEHLSFALYLQKGIYQKFLIAHYRQSRINK